jgi:hypothetical protein
MDPDSMTAFWKRSLGMRGELNRYLRGVRKRKGRKGRKGKKGGGEEGGCG